MSGFVNYGKRSVQLPAGCKDLIDVLQGRPAAKSGAGVAAFGTKITRDSQATISVIDLLGPITDLLKSKAWSRALTVSSCDYALTVTVSVSADELLVCFCAREPAHAEAVLKFLSRHGLDVRNQQEGPHPFTTGRAIYSVNRPPSEPSALSNLIELLFRDVCVLNADSEVIVRQIEVEVV